MTERVAWLDRLQLDFRHACRALTRTPGSTAVAILTLAVCFAANTAMFAAVESVLFRPLQIRQPLDLVICWADDRPHNLPVVELSYRNFEDWAKYNRSFSRLAAMGSTTWPAVWDAKGQATRLVSSGVSTSFFDALGVAPILGRTFRSDDDAPKALRVMILSHGMWRSRFGADPRVIGTTVMLDETYTIVGVMPQDFDFPAGTDFWTPVVPVLAAAGAAWDAKALESVGVLFAIGRLRAGVTPEMAREDLARVSAQREREGAPRLFGAGVVVTPFVTYLFGPVRQALWALLVAVAVLLLIGCLNISGLMMTRLSMNWREYAVRLALGATSGRMAQSWLLETLLIAIAGGAAGLVAWPWIAKAIALLAPGDVRGLSSMEFSVPVAIGTLITIVAAALLCGAAPIRFALTSNLLGALNDSARSTPGRKTFRARSAIVMLQMALSVTLLVAAGLVVRSFANLRQTDLGFDPSNVVTMAVEPRNPKPSENAWTHDLLDRIRSLPTVTAAGAVYLSPLALGPIGQETLVLLEGQPDTPTAWEQNPRLNYQVATSGFFSAMKTSLRRGRVFDDNDDARATRVAIVGESTARRLWPGQDPIGKRVLMPQFVPDSTPVWRTVVGVVNDVRYRGLDDIRLDIYDASLQAATGATDVMIRTSGDPRVVTSAVQAEARRLDAHVLFDRVTTLDAIVARAMAPWRFSVWLFAAFAGVAILLACVGLYSLVNLDVTQRQREWAIRRALGAQTRDIAGPVLRAAGTRALAGAAAGVATAAVSVRAMQSMLFGVGTVDLTTYLAVGLLVVVVVAIATWLPARRASEVDPMGALRSE